MFLPHRQGKRNGGFSLLEIVVIVLVLGLLAGLTTPLARNLILDSRAQRIVEVSDRLRAACQRFWLDTGRPAIEGTLADGAAVDSSLADPSTIVHELYEGPGIRNWRGPYIDHPLAEQDFFVNGGACVLNSLDSVGGFYLQGLSNGLSKGAGNVLWLGEVEIEIAKIIDEQLDHSATDEERPRTGRVVFQPSTPPGGKTPMWIFLLGAP